MIEFAASSHSPQVLARSREHREERRRGRGREPQRAWSPRDEAGGGGGRGSKVTGPGLSGRAGLVYVSGAGAVWRARPARRRRSTDT